MKKIISVFLCVVAIFLFNITAYGADKEKSDNSTPRFMVENYTVDKGKISPSKKSVIKITYKNYSKNQAIHNIKLSFSEDSGDIVPDGTGTKYVSKVPAEGTYIWELTVSASKTAQVGQHKTTVSAEYEDKNGEEYSSTDNMLISVKQKTRLDYSGIVLPKKIAQDDTATMEINLMNTGKSVINNAKISFDIDGLETGGVLFIGSINSGESATGTANFSTEDDKIGKTDGNATLSYEDEYGKEYKKSIPIKTEITKKTVTTSNTDDKKHSKYSLWWLFTIAGLIVGATIGAIIPITIQKKKQMIEDEKRL